MLLKSNCQILFDALYYTVNIVDSIRNESIEVFGRGIDGLEFAFLKGESHSRYRILRRVE